MELVVKLWDEVKNNYYSPIGLFLGILIIIITFISIIGLSIYLMQKLIVLFFLIILWVFIWLYIRRVPRNKYPHVGFIVSIITENESDQIKLKSDFIDTLSSLLDLKDLKYKFQLIIYPNYYAKRITNSEIAGKYLLKSNASFMIFGKCRLRKDNGKDTYILDINGIVKHKEISKEVKDKLSAEFSEVLPKRIKISLENDLRSFEITSQIIDITSKYIISIASIITGDLDYSITLLNSLKPILSNFNQNIPFIKLVKERSIRRLSVIYNIKATIEYNKYRKTKDKEQLSLLKSYLDLVEGKDKFDIYYCSLLKSIYYFLIKDIPKAKNELSICQGIDIDSNWRLSKAFLHAYENDLLKAHSEYKKAFKKNIGYNTTFDVEIFINDVLEEEPDKHQLYFCLGLINFYEKEDFFSAKSDFEKFLHTADLDKRSSKIAESYIKKIESKLSRKII